VEPVAFFGGSSEPGIVLDSRGVPHMFYCPPGDVRYASRNGTGWSDEHVVFTPFGGICGQLVMEPGDIPHITTPWATGYGGELYGTRGNGSWDLAVYPGGLLGAVNARGEPQVVTYLKLGPGQFSFRYLTLANDAWTHEDVETFAAASVTGAAWASVALDASDEPHVLYYDSIRGDVRYAFRNASGWHVEVVEHIGDVQAVGRQGSLAFDSRGSARAVYSYRMDSTTQPVRYAERSASGWTSETMEPDIGLFPSIAVALDGSPQVAYIREHVLDAVRKVVDQDLAYAVRGSGGWEIERVYDGLVDLPHGIVVAPQFSVLASDRCDRPHIAFHLGSVTGDAGVYYATKGPPCQSPSPSVSLRLEPRTLNLRSQGRWVNAQIAVENATSNDIDSASLALNDVPAARVEVQNNTTLMAKFDRQAFGATVRPGESVVVTLTGRWRDGGAFTATDVIRVTSPGKP